MRVSLYARVTLKDRPKEHRGIYSEDFTVGKDAFVPFDSMVKVLIEQLGNYYARVHTIDELNEQLDKIATYCQRVRFEDEQE